MNLLAIIRGRISEKPIIPTVNDVNDTEKSHDEFGKVNDAFGIEDLILLKEKASSTPDPIITQPQPVEISAADQILVDWFLQAASLPTASFDLDCARRVFDPEKFFAAIRREIDTRQSSPRWRCGATQFDLEILRKLFGQEA